MAPLGENLRNLAPLLTRLEQPFTSNQLRTHLEEWEAHYFKLDPEFVPNTTTWPAEQFVKTLPETVEAAVLLVWKQGTQHTWDEMRRIVLCGGRNMDYHEAVVCWESWCEYCACPCHEGKAFSELPVCDAMAAVNHPSSGNPMVPPPPTALRRPRHIPRLPGARAQGTVTTAALWVHLSTTASFTPPVEPTAPGPLPLATVLVSADATHCVVNDRSLLAGLRRIVLPVVASTGISGNEDAAALHEGILVLWRSDIQAGIVVENVLYAPDSPISVLTADAWLCHQLRLGSSGALRAPLYALKHFFPVPRYPVDGSCCSLFQVAQRAACPDPASLRQVALVHLQPPPSTAEDGESSSTVA
ncbi:uncharacterized protein LOC62_06G008034 [Vanrija pseudolonga]|uniref:Uncharacterized protein n=1 Tax=Vanrija pseudolonga TaxID=143232 RepID=A0AAF0YDQ8_9TREE|nr:hypothetical protein LOC62_06G008034 [Vanrija pseudolonga]